MSRSNDTVDVQLEQDKCKMQIVWRKTCFCFKLIVHLKKKKKKKKKENLLVGINRMIKELCLSDGCKYFDNDNIPRDMLYKVGLHLFDKGVSFLIKLQV